MTQIDFRKYGQGPCDIVVVHGGPGAPGEMKPVAIELSSEFGVLEPFQTKDTIAGEIEELKSIIEKEGSPPVILIGYSWGAWLCFITAAKYPNLVRKLILVGSGPFEAKYAKEIMPARLNRLSSEDRSRSEEITRLLEKKENQHNNELLAEFGKLMAKADTFDPLPVPEDNEDPGVRMDIYQSIWPEADELRRSGDLLDYGRKITCPVVVIHGEYDPGPYKGVRKPLSKVLKNEKYILLSKCGHHPWFEKGAKDEFYRVLRAELTN